MERITWQEEGFWGRNMNLGSLEGLDLWDQQLCEKKDQDCGSKSGFVWLAERLAAKSRSTPNWWKELRVWVFSQWKHSGGHLPCRRLPRFKEVNVNLQSWQDAVPREIFLLSFLFSLLYCIKLATKSSPFTWPKGHFTHSSVQPPVSYHWDIVPIHSSGPFVLDKRDP